MRPVLFALETGEARDAQTLGGLSRHVRAAETKKKKQFHKKKKKKGEKGIALFPSRSFRLSTLFSAGPSVVSGAADLVLQVILSATRNRYWVSLSRYVIAYARPVAEHAPSAYHATGARRARVG